MPGNGEVRSTGQLGEVMRESVHAALSHIKMAPQRYGIDPRRLNCDLHVHLPEAATAKEGPSAGITVFAALLSALKEKPLPADLAMTGEITLTGDVLPVGGIRVKLLAAERAGTRRVLIPEHNHADVPPDLHLEVIRVERLEQALPILLGNSERSETSVPNARSDQTPASDAGAA
jgi:ATP-dependent Lon protease